MDFYEAPATDLEDELNPGEFKLGDPHAYERLMPSRRQAQNANASAQLFSSPDAEMGFKILSSVNPSINPSFNNALFTVNEGPVDAEGKPKEGGKCADEKCSLKPDALKLLGFGNSTDGLDEQKQKPTGSFTVPLVNEVENKSPVEQCKECCQAVEKAWKERCKILHNAIEKQLRIVGAPATVTMTANAKAYAASKTKAPSKFKRSRRPVRRSVRRSRRY